MPYQIGWLQEQRVISAVLEGDFVIQDIQQFQTAVTEMLQVGIAPVHIIIDVTQLGKHPTNIREMASASTYVNHPNVGWTVLINPSRITSFVVTIVGGVMGIKNKTTHTLEEAIATLHQVDLTLPRD